jgi:hypothetical protein
METSEDRMFAKLMVKGLNTPQLCRLLKRSFLCMEWSSPPVPILLGSKVPGKPVRANQLMHPTTYGKDQAIIPQH